MLNGHSKSTKRKRGSASGAAYADATNAPAIKQHDSCTNKKRD